MLDSGMCSALLPPSVGMSILGEHPLLDRGFGLGLGLGPPPYPPMPPRLWRPTVWGSPPPPPCPPPPVPTLPLCPEPCHLPALAGVGVSHLFDYMTSARLWYPWYYKGDSVFSGAASLDYDVGSKELPSRALKQDRLKERQDLAHALHIDKDHAAAINARKTASTQTQFSSFNGEAPPYPGPPPAYFAPRGEPHPGDGYSPVHHGYCPPPPPLAPTSHTTSLPSPSSLSPPASSHLVDLSHAHVGQSDIQNAPLNLSLSSTPTAVSSSLVTARQLARPTVITCTSSPSSSPVSSGGSSPRSQNGHAQHSPTSNNSPPVSDPAIEEHFRRSLGKSYGDSIPKTTAVTTSSVQANISITGSVDDHFAKALGDSTWKAIKSQNDPALDVFTGSVDDHFAKALGANTWRRIKAETEISENSSANINNNNSTATSSTPTTASPHSGSSLSTPVAT